MTPHQPLPPPSEQPPSPAYPGRLGAWLAFTRPKTWLLAVAPVLAALALAWAEAHAFSPVVALLTLTIAVLMQAISNMENDLGYSSLLLYGRPETNCLYPIWRGFGSSLFWPYCCLRHVLSTNIRTDNQLHSAGRCIRHYRFWRAGRQ